MAHEVVDNLHEVLLVDPAQQPGVHLARHALKCVARGGKLRALGKANDGRRLASEDGTKVLLEAHQRLRRQGGGSREQKERQVDTADESQRERRMLRGGCCEGASAVRDAQWRRML